MNSTSEVREASEPATCTLSKSASLRPDGLWEGIVQIQGIHCGACSEELERLADAVKGLQSFNVNAAVGLGRWVGKDPQAIETVALLAKQRGYQFGQGDVHAISESVVKKSRRTSLLRLSVALLCAMQVMMYSTPEYLFSSKEIGLSSVQLLRWAQWVLAWPVVLFSARPLFVKAWGALKGRHWAMEQVIVAGMLLAFGSSTLNLNNPNLHVWFDSVVMLVALLTLSYFLIDRYRFSTWSFLNGLRPDLPPQVLKRHGKQWLKVGLSEVKAGDVLKLNHEEVLAFDAELIQPAQGIWVDERVRTGESRPIHKRQGAHLFAGSTVLGEQVKIRVLESLDRGSFNQLGKLIQRALTAKPREASLADRVVPFFALGVLLSASLTGLIWWGLGVPLPQVWQVVLSVLLVTCPCALALAQPLVNLRALRILAGKGILVNQVDALARLTQVDYFAFDKTGTLTGEGDANVSLKALRSLGPHFPVDRVEIKVALALALAKESNHPMSKALVDALFKTYADEVAEIELLNCLEIPGQGLSAVVMHKQVKTCMFVRLGNAQFCEVEAQQQDPQASFYLSVAQGSELNAMDAQSFVPVLSVQINFKNCPLELQRLAGLREFGDMALLSGDSAYSVAHWEPDMQFKVRHHRLSPEDKAAWVRHQQGLGHRVAMCGDGLNDAAAFAQADVAFAVAGAATLSAIHADFILTRPDPSLVLDVCRLASKAAYLSRENFIWAIGYNVVGVSLAATGFLTPLMAAVGMGLSSLLVVLNSARLKGEG